jgi:hypothetical protein
MKTSHKSDEFKKKSKNAGTYGPTKNKKYDEKRHISKLAYPKPSNYISNIWQKLYLNHMKI